MRTLATGMIGLLLAACGDGGSGGHDMGAAATDMACNSALYPCGPYGPTQGDVLPDITLPVQTDTNGNGVIDAADPVTMVSMSAYYQNKGIKALFVSAAAFWCGPCKQEQPALITLYNGYGGKNSKVAFLEAIVQKADMSVAGTADVDAWAQTYNIPFDMASDPTAAISPFYGGNAMSFPWGMVVRTKDMTITWAAFGDDAVARKGAIDAVLNAP